MIEVDRLERQTVWFRLPLLLEPRAMGKHPSRPCAVCGELWRPWAGSRLPCHARCLFTDEGRRELLALFRDETVLGGYAALAKHFGVSASVIRSVLRTMGVRCSKG